jgi:glycosyltransferase involved in cell wall biosynthesis
MFLKTGMQNPKVSIIIPNYNHVQYLEERIESVLNQTYQDFEIILLDDSSTDNSLQILSRYESHPKVSHFEVNQQNSGSVFKQWVKGIKLAKGEYIWIAESDDVAHSGFLEKMVDFAEQKNDFGLAFCKSNIIDENGNDTGKTFSFENNNPNFKIKGIDSVSEYLIKWMVIANASGVLFSKCAFKEIDYDKLVQFKNTGDRYTYIQIGLKRSIFYIDESLNFYRAHNSNTTKKNIANYAIYRDRLNIVSEMILECSKSTIASKNLLEFYLKQTFILFKANSFKKNQSVLFKLFKLSFIDSNSLLSFSFLNLLTSIFKGSIPHFIRMKYKGYILSKFDIQL